MLIYLGVAALAGAVNLWNAWRQLQNDCRFLIFFRPWKSIGFYFWFAAQVVIPSMLCWLTLGFQSRPNIDVVIAIAKSIFIGIGFVAMMNATTQIVGFNLNIRAIYHLFIRVAYNLIADQETARTAQFWQACKAELRASPTLQDGFTYLREYVKQDVSRTEEEKASTLSVIDRAQAEPDRQKQADQIQAVMLVRRPDLPIVLQKFGCSDRLLSGSLG